MALDEVFLLQTSQKAALPTLRLYAWDPPALSLGYSQKSEDANLNELQAKGWDLVRRPTGGKGILHIDELTYSITAPVDEPLVAGTLLESYQRISSILQHALHILGVETSADKKYDLAQTPGINPICFEVPSNFEITCKGKKLIGSAQARKAGGVLQHGSLPLLGDLGRITQVLKFSNEQEQKQASEKVRSRAITLEEAAGRAISWDEVAAAMINAFSLIMDVRFDPCEPTKEELILASKLEKEKYSTPAWNYRL